MKLPGRLIVAAAASLLLLGACSDDDSNDNRPSGGGAAAAAPQEKFAVITHGTAGDAFWDVVKKGAEQAGKDLGVSVTYQSNGDAAGQADLINAAVADKVSGLVVSLADPDVLAGPIHRATAAGIPVVTINSGQDASARLGALAHVGQDESVAGQGAGTRLAAEGVTTVLCIVHEAGNIGLEQRCDGVQQTLGGAVENVQVDIDNVAEARNTISARLRQDPSIDGVLALNPAMAMAAVDAVASSGSTAKVATFDLSNDVVDAISAGKIIFAVDQQQYEQGYLPIVLLHLYVTNGNTVGGGKPVLTGPGFVTKDNADQVRDLAGKGTR